MLAGAVVLLVLALAAGGVAAVQTERAQDNAADARTAADSAREAAISADARRVGARAQLTDDISLSLLLAAAGARLDDSPETRVNLLTAMAKHPRLVRSGPPGGGFLNGLTVSPDGRWIASSDDQNRMHLYDATTNRLLRSYDAGRPPEGEQAFMIGAFNRHSTQLAVILEASESTEPVRLLDPHTMEPTTKLASPAAGRSGGSMSRSALTVATWPPPCRRSTCWRVPAARATRWSGTSAPRPRDPCGSRSARTSQGWLSARTVSSSTPASR